MSVNTLPYNPELLDEVAVAVATHFTSNGIINITSPDNNIVANVVGSTAQLSLASNITVSNQVNCNTANCSNIVVSNNANCATVNTSNLVVANFNNPWTQNQPSTNGQVLASNTNGTLSWVNASSGGLTNVQSADGNLITNVVGTVCNVLFASNISVAGTMTAGTGLFTIGGFENPWLAHNPSVSGQVLSCDTSGNLSWITPSTASTTGLLKLFYQSNGQNTVQTGNTTVDIWSNSFTNLDTTKQYVIRVNASWYVDTNSGGVAGAGFIRFQRGITAIQQYNTYYNTVNSHLYFSFTFDAYTPSSANELWTIFAQSSTGNLNTDTSDYFNVEINEVQ